MAERVHWADAARGIGIIMVVFSHSWRGLQDAGLIADKHIFYDIDTALYLVHMPLFFALSGMFYCKAIQHKDISAILWKKFFTIVYPYFLWSAVLIFVSWAMASLVNRPFSLAALQTLPVVTVGPFWFLYTLFLTQIIALVVFRVFRASPWTAVGLGLLMLTASFFVSAYIPHQVMYYFIFFAAGAAFAEDASLTPATRPGFAVLCGLLYLGGLAVVLPSGLEFSAPALLPLSVLAIAAVVGLACAGTASRFAHRLDGLIALGRVSMAIYVMHVMFTAGTRVVLVSLLGVKSLPVLLAACIVAGLAGPMIAYAIVHRLRLDPVFGFAAPGWSGTRVALSRP